MGNLSIRKIDEETLRRLRLRAAAQGVSMEEEARRILAGAVAPTQPIVEVFGRRFGKRRGIDLSVPERDKYDPVRLKQ